MSSARIRRQNKDFQSARANLSVVAPGEKKAFLGLAGGSEPMDNTKEPAGHLSAIIAIGLLLIGLVVFEVVQQKAWSH